MAPVRLIDTPGYVIRLTNNSPLPRHYRDLIREGYDFVVGRKGPDTYTQAASELDLKEKNVGGASEYRPLTYSELDKNFKEVYPVGSIYMNADDDTDPGILMGFGVWERLSSGNSLLGTNLNPNASVEIKHKITSAYYNKSSNSSTGLLYIKLQSRASVGEIEAQRRQPKAKTVTAEERREFNYYPGLKVNIQGIKTQSGSTGPTGLFTILSVDSDKSGNSDVAVSGTEELNKDAYDQNIIVIRYTDNSLPNNQNVFYDITGANKNSTRDNAYCTVLDNITTAAGTTGGTKLADVDITQMPPHVHDTNLTTREGPTGATGAYDSHDNWKPNWAGGKSWTTWDTRKTGNLRVPASYSTSDENQRASDVSAAGAGTTGAHENRQPYVAVHMWKRIQ